MQYRSRWEPSERRCCGGYLEDGAISCSILPQQSQERTTTPNECNQLADTTSMRGKDPHKDPRLPSSSGRAGSLGVCEGYQCAHPVSTWVGSNPDGRARKKMDVGRDCKHAEQNSC